MDRIVRKKRPEIVQPSDEELATQEIKSILDRYGCQISARVVIENERISSEVRVHKAANGSKKTG